MLSTAKIVSLETVDNAKIFSLGTYWIHAEKFESGNIEYMPKILSGNIESTPKILSLETYLIYGQNFESGNVEYMAKILRSII